MAIEGGQRNCGAHELICARKVSPEVLGFLSTIAVFSLLMILLFLYLSNKLSLDNATDLSHPDSKHQKSKDLKARNTWDSSSDSEDDGIEKNLEATQRGAQSWHQQGCSWDTKQKYSFLSAEQEGYYREASTEEASCVQMMRHTPPLDELQPPPYQDENGTSQISPAHSARGNTEHRSSLMSSARAPSRGQEKSLSDGSGDQETESYLTKGYEEDVPSDSTAVLGAEDVSAHGSALQFPIGYEPEPLAKYGTLDVAFDYDSKEQRLAVTVTAATDIPALKSMGNVAWQVHLVLLPTKKQRAKTGIQKGPCPVFTETFRFSPVEQDAIGSYAVRFRLYSVRRMKKEKVLGEKVFYLTKLNLQGKVALPVTLEPGCGLTQGCGSLVSVTRSEGTSSFRSAGRASSAEILVGLVYSAATGRLSVEIIKGCHFKNMAADKPPNGLFCCLKHVIGGQVYIIRDTYVKMTMLNSMGQQISKCKTSVSRGQPDPTYQETFVFQVALFQLSEVTLVLSVHCKRGGVRRKERLGWVSLGLNSSGEEELLHWSQMKDTEGQQVCRWHSLLDS